jgi:class 3 adenylate cyclase
MTFCAALTGDPGTPAPLTLPRPDTDEPDELDPGAPQITELVVGFVDLSGSTALAARVPAPDYARAMAEFRSVTTATVTTWGGRLVKVVGDGALFLAPDAATGAAVAFALIAACADRPGLPALRGGLAVGDVVMDGDDCFGLAVNVAAKSAALARPGSVLATRAVLDRLDTEDRRRPAHDAPDGGLFHLPAVVELFELAGV